MRNACEKIFSQFLAKVDGGYRNPRAVVVMETRSGKLTWSSGEDTLFDPSDPEAFFVSWTGDETGCAAINWAHVVRVYATAE